MGALLQVSCYTRRFIKVLALLLLAATCGLYMVHKGDHLAGQATARLLEVRLERKLTQWLYTRRVYKSIYQIPSCEPVCSLVPQRRAAMAPTPAGRRFHSE